MFRSDTELWPCSTASVSNPNKFIGVISLITRPSSSTKLKRSFPFERVRMLPSFVRRPRAGSVNPASRTRLKQAVARENHGFRKKFPNAPQSMIIVRCSLAAAFLASATECSFIKKLGPFVSLGIPYTRPTSAAVQNRLVRKVHWAQKSNFLL